MCDPVAHNADRVGRIKAVTGSPHSKAFGGISAFLTKHAFFGCFIVNLPIP